MKPCDSTIKQHGQDQFTFVLQCNFLLFLEIGLSAIALELFILLEREHKNMFFETAFGNTRDFPGCFLVKEINWFYFIVLLINYQLVKNVKLQPQFRWTGSKSLHHVVLVKTYRQSKDTVGIHLLVERCQLHLSTSK